MSRPACLLYVFAAVSLVFIPKCSGGDFLHVPVWFTELMASKNCTFTHMLYSNNKCDLRLFFNGAFPYYMQVVGLGLNEKLEPDTKEFAEAICKCGVMEVTGSCSDSFLRLLGKLREDCGEDNIRSVPDLKQTQQQWLDREPPLVYQTVLLPDAVVDDKKQTEVALQALEVIRSKQQAAEATKDLPIQEDSGSSIDEETEKEPEAGSAPGKGEGTDEDYVAAGMYF